MCTKFWSENPKGRDHLEETGIDGKEMAGRFGLGLQIQ